MCFFFSTFLFLPYSIRTCSENSTTLEKFHLRIKQYELYAEDEPLINVLLHEMATKPIVHVSKYRHRQLHIKPISQTHSWTFITFIKLVGRGRMRAHVNLFRNVSFVGEYRIREEEEEKKNKEWENK